VDLSHSSNWPLSRSLTSVAVAGPLIAAFHSSGQSYWPTALVDITILVQRHLEGIFLSHLNCSYLCLLYSFFLNWSCTMGAIRTPSSSRAPAGTSSSSPPTRTLNASYMESAEVVSTAKRKRAADDGLEAVKSAKRKKNVATATSGLVDVVNLTGGSSPVDTTTTATPKKRKSKSTTSPGAQLPERRARVFRKHPPRSYLEKLARATSQRYEIYQLFQVSVLVSL